MTTATIPQEAGHQRARRQLHQGLLHRPGDGRPPALQGQAQPPPARPAPRARPATDGDPMRLGERERRARSARPSSPPPAARSRSRSCAARPSRRATVEVGERHRRRGRRAALLTRRGRRGPELALRARPSVNVASMVAQGSAESLPGRSIGRARGRGELAALAVAGCGASSNPQDPRPSPQLEVSASVNPDKVQITPDKFGAGVVNFTVANLSGSPITFSVNGPQKASTVQIQPGAPDYLKIEPQGGHVPGDRRQLEDQAGDDQGRPRAAELRQPPAAALVRHSGEGL